MDIPKQHKNRTQQQQKSKSKAQEKSETDLLVFFYPGYINRKPEKKKHFKICATHVI